MPCGLTRVGDETALRTKHRTTYEPGNDGCSQESVSRHIVELCCRWQLLREAEQHGEHDDDEDDAFDAVHGDRHPHRAVSLRGPSDTE